MKRFQVEWQEYLPSALIDGWEVGCSGFASVMAQDSKSAGLLWRRIFPRSKVISIKENDLQETHPDPVLAVSS